MAREKYSKKYKDISKELKAYGFILSIASKNDEKTVWKLLKKEI